MKTQGVISDPSRAAAPIPKIRLFVEKVWVDKGNYGAVKLSEVDAALVELSFNYGGQVLPAWEEWDLSSSQVFLKGPGASVQRDTNAEMQARRELESCGAVDLDAAEHYGVPPDVSAHYLVHVDVDEQACCAFYANALPKLREAGFEIEIDPNYPYQTLSPDDDSDWYAKVTPIERNAKKESKDWFGLEFGVLVQGERINLVPVFLELLRESRSRTLQGLSRARKTHAVRISSTHCLALPQDRLRSLLQVVIELYNGAMANSAYDDMICFERSAADSLSRLESAFGESLNWEGDADVRTWGNSLTISPPAVDSVPQLKATLRPYQRDGVAWLQHLRSCGVGGILADDMGLGKTLQTIAHICIEHGEGRMQGRYGNKRVLIVAPTSLVGNWKKELEKFAPHLSVHVHHGPKRHRSWDASATCDVIITSFPLLVRDKELLCDEAGDDPSSDAAYHLVVLDEAHTIKNSRSQVNRACKQLNAANSLCLTGTPVENHLGELWALVDFLNPGMLGSEASFKQWYRTPIEEHGDEERLLALREKIAPYILRRLKSEVAKELPPKTEMIRPVELAGKQRDLYEAIRVAAHAKVRKSIAKKGFAASQVPILDALTKLRQVCCDPRLVKMDAARFVRESAKYEKLFELFDQHLPEGRRILLFSQFTSMLDLISKGLQDKGIKHLMLTGASKRRQDLVDRFEAGEADVFLISLKAGGTGLNLVSADTVIHYDPWWNPTAQAQATDRAYRIGQKRPVFVHNLIVAGSVEERMVGLQRKKRRLADGILGGDIENTALREDDLSVLFAPLG